MNLLQRNDEVAWHHQLTSRLLLHWRYKLIAGAVLSIGFYLGYFLILYFPVFPVTEMPVTAIDRLIGFWSTSLLMYITLWPYILLGAWLLSDKRELITYVRALGGLGIAGLLVFFFWPTSVPRPDIDLTLYPSFTMLVALDEPRNVFPSLHAAFAVFTAICIGRLLRELGERGLFRFLSWCWCVAILYSALATKQHLAIDLLGGTVLGVAWAVAYLRYFTWIRQGNSIQLRAPISTEAVALESAQAVDEINSSDITFDALATADHD